MVGSYTLSEVKLEKRFMGSLPIEDDNWQVGVIVGRSGSGKTSIANIFSLKTTLEGLSIRINVSLTIFLKNLRQER